MSRLSSLCVSLSLASLTGCAGTDVGNPVDMDFTLYDTRDPGGGGALRARPAVDEGLVITDAWVSVDRIRLRDAAACDGSAEIEVLGPIAVNLRAPGAPAALTGIEVPSLAYCRFEFRWSPLPEPVAGAPADLLDTSIYLAGTRGDGTTFVVRSDRSDELRLDARNGSFTLDTTTTGLFVGFDVATVFDGVALDTATISSDGTIHIEDGDNANLLALIEDNIDTAAMLFDDDDGDGELGEVERDNAEVLAETP